MAQADVQNILQGLRIGQEKRAARARTELEQQRLEQQRQAQEAEIKIRHESLDEQKRQFDATQKVHAARAALDQMQQKQEITANIMKGIDVPGSSKSPAAFGPMGGFTPVHPEDATHQVTTLPTGDEVTTPTMNEQARQGAAAYEIANKPKEEALRREKGAEEEARAKQAEISKAADFARTMSQKAMDDSRATEDRASREMIAAAGNASREKVARIAASTKGKLSPEWENYDISPHVMDALSGNISREDVSRMTLPPQLKMALIDGVKASGGNLLSKDQQKVASEYSGLVDIVKTMDELLTKIPQNMGKGVMASGLASIKGAYAGLDKDITSLEQRLEGNATIIGRTVSKDNRVSDQDAKRVGLGFFPSKSDLLENNIKKRNDYVQRVNGAIDAKLSTVPLGQRAIIKKKLGLDTLPMLPLPGQQGQQGQPARQGTWTPQGIQWQ